MMSRLKSKMSEFLRDSEGSATIEFLLWMPILTFIICLSADTALFFGYKATVLRIIGDANRAASIGRLTTEAATESFVTERLGSYGDVATVTVVMDDDGLVVTTVSIPTSEVTATGILEGLSVDALVVQSHQLMET